MPDAVLDEQAFLDDALRLTREGNLAYVMFVDYHTADCGPYRELLFMPGSCDFSGQRCLTISKIYVSSLSSIVNGARNWGIPKEHCDFDVQYGKDGIDRIRARKNGKVFVDLHLTHSGLRLPAKSSWIPERFRRLGQLRHGMHFIYTPKGRGNFRRAAMLCAEVDAAYFPDFTQGKLQFACRVTDFEMIFPVADIQPTHIDSDLE
nr:acetoacetate decarboxylase family protein [Chitinivorax tropicus]